MYVDVVTQHAYTMLTTGSNSWNNIYEICLTYGPTARMLSIDSYGESTFVDTITQQVRVPVFRIRNSTGAFGVWADGTRVVTDDWSYTAWANGYPVTTPGNDCMEYVNQRNQNSKMCNDTSAYNNYVCEFPQSFFAGQLAWTLSPTAYSAHTAMTLTNLIDPSIMPAATIQPIYGATVMTSAYECRKYDRFLFTASHDSISMWQGYNLDCMMMLAGNSTVTSYNTVLQGMVFRGIYPYRNTMKFGFVYWTNYAINQLTLDLDSLKVFGFHYATTAFTPVAPYPFYDARGYCINNGMSLAEYLNQGDLRESRRGAITFDYTQQQWLGLQRTSNTAPYTWWTGNAMAQQDWMPRRPLQTANLCAL